MTPNIWLNPVYVAKSKSELDVMLSSALYLDIDEKGDNVDSILRCSFKNMRKIINYLDYNYEKKPDRITFSGNKGFHIVLHNWDWDTVKFLTPTERITKFIEKRKNLWKSMKSQEIFTDLQAMEDPYRILRIPGSLNIKSQLPSFIIREREAESFLEFRKKFKSIEKKIQQIKEVIIK